MMLNLQGLLLGLKLEEFSHFPCEFLYVWHYPDIWVYIRPRAVLVTPLVVIPGVDCGHDDQDDGDYDHEDNDDNDVGE